MEDDTSETKGIVRKHSNANDKIKRLNVIMPTSDSSDPASPRVARKKSRVGSAVKNSIANPIEHSENADIEDEMKDLREQVRALPLETVFRYNLVTAGAVLRAGIATGKSMGSSSSPSTPDALFSATVRSTMQTDVFSFARFSTVEVLDIDWEGNAFIEYLGVTDWISLEDLNPKRGGPGVLSKDGLFLATIGMDFTSEDIVVSQGDEVEVVGVDRYGLAAVRVFANIDGNLMTVLEGIVPIRILMKHPRLGGSHLMGTDALCTATITAKFGVDGIALSPGDTVDIVNIDYQSNTLIRFHFAELWTELSNLSVVSGGPGVPDEDVLFQARLLKDTLAGKANDRVVVLKLEFGQCTIRNSHTGSSDTFVVDRDLLYLFSRLGGKQPMGEDVLCRGTVFDCEDLPLGAIVDVIDVDSGGRGTCRFNDKLVSVNLPDILFWPGGAGVYTEDGIFNARVEVETILKDDDVVDVPLAAGEKLEVLDFDLKGNVRVTHVRSKKEGWVPLMQIIPLARGKSLESDLLFAASARQDISCGSGTIGTGFQVSVIQLDFDGNVEILFNGDTVWIPLRKLDPFRGGVGVSDNDALFSAALLSAVPIGRSTHSAGTVVDVVEVDLKGHALVRTANGDECRILLHLLCNICRLNNLESQQFSNNSLFKATPESSVVIKGDVCAHGTFLDVLDISADDKVLLEHTSGPCWVDINQVQMIPGGKGVLSDDALCMATVLEGDFSGKLVQVLATGLFGMVSVRSYDLTSFSVNLRSLRLHRRKGLFEMFSDTCIFRIKRVQDTTVGDLKLPRGAVLEVDAVGSNGFLLVRLGNQQQWISSETVEYLRGGPGVLNDDTICMASDNFGVLFEVLELRVHMVKIRKPKSLEITEIEIDRLNLLPRIAPLLHPNTLFRAVSARGGAQILVGDELIPPGIGVEVYGFGENFNCLVRIGSVTDSIHWRDLKPIRGGIGVRSGDAFCSGTLCSDTILSDNKVIAGTLVDVLDFNPESGMFLVLSTGSMCTIPADALCLHPRAEFYYLHSRHALCTARVITATDFTSIHVGIGSIVEVLDFNHNDSVLIRYCGFEGLISVRQLDLQTGGPGVSNSDELFSAVVKVPIFSGSLCAPIGSRVSILTVLEGYKAEVRFAGETGRVNLSTLSPTPRRGRVDEFPLGVLFKAVLSEKSKLEVIKGEPKVMLGSLVSVMEINSDYRARCVYYGNQSWANLEDLEVSTGGFGVCLDSSWCLAVCLAPIPELGSTVPGLVVDVTSINPVTRQVIVSSNNVPYQLPISEVALYSRATSSSISFDFKVCECTTKTSVILEGIKFPKNCSVSVLQFNANAMALVSRDCKQGWIPISDLSFQASNVGMKLAPSNVLKAIYNTEYVEVSRIKYNGYALLCGQSKVYNSAVPMIDLLPLPICGIELTHETLFLAAYDDSIVHVIDCKGHDVSYRTVSGELATASYQSISPLKGGPGVESGTALCIATTMSECRVNEILASAGTFLEVLDLDENGDCLVSLYGQKGIVAISNLRLHPRITSMLGLCEPGVLFRGRFNSCEVEVLGVDSDLNAEVLVYQPHGRSRQTIPVSSITPRVGGPGVRTADSIAMGILNGIVVDIIALDEFGKVCCKDIADGSETWVPHADLLYLPRRQVQVSSDMLFKVVLRQELELEQGFVSQGTIAEVIDITPSGAALIRVQGRQGWVELSTVDTITSEGEVLAMGELIKRVYIRGIAVLPGTRVELVGVRSDGTCQIRHEGVTRWVKGHNISLRSKLSSTDEFNEQDVIFTAVERKTGKRVHVLDVKKDVATLHTGEQVNFHKLVPIFGGKNTTESNTVCLATLKSRVSGFDVGEVLNVVSFDPVKGVLVKSTRTETQTYIPSDDLKLHTKQELAQLSGVLFLARLKSDGSVVNVIDMDGRGRLLLGGDNQRWVAEIDVDVVPGGVGVVKDDALCVVRDLVSGKEFELSELPEFGKGFTVDGEIVNYDQVLPINRGQRALPSDVWYQASLGEKVVQVIGFSKGIWKVRDSSGLVSDQSSIVPHTGGMGTISADALMCATLIDDVVGEIPCHTIVEVLTLSEDTVRIRSGEIVCSVPRRALTLHPRYETSGRFIMQPDALFCARITIATDGLSVGTLVDVLDIDYDQNILISTPTGLVWRQLCNFSPLLGGPGVLDQITLVSGVWAGDSVSILEFLPGGLAKVKLHDDQVLEVDMEELTFKRRWGGDSIAGSQVLFSAYVSEILVLDAGLVVPIGCSVKVTDLDTNGVCTVNYYGMLGKVDYRLLHCAVGGRGVVSNDALCMACVLRSELRFLEPGRRVELIQLKNTGEALIRAAENSVTVPLIDLQLLPRDRTAGAVSRGVICRAKTVESISSDIGVIESGSKVEILHLTDDLVTVRVDGVQTDVDVNSIELLPGGQGVSQPDVFFDAILKQSLNLAGSTMVIGSRVEVVACRFDNCVVRAPGGISGVVPLNGLTITPRFEVGIVNEDVLFAGKLICDAIISNNLCSIGCEVDVLKVDLFGNGFVRLNDALVNWIPLDKIAWDYGGLGVQTEDGLLTAMVKVSPDSDTLIDGNIVSPTTVVEVLHVDDGGMALVHFGNSSEDWAQLSCLELFSRRASMLIDHDILCKAIDKSSGGTVEVLSFDAHGRANIRVNGHVRWADLDQVELLPGGNGVAKSDVLFTAKMMAPLANTAFVFGKVVDVLQVGDSGSLRARADGEESWIPMKDAEIRTRDGVPELPKDVLFSVEGQFGSGNVVDIDNDGNLLVRTGTDAKWISAGKSKMIRGGLGVDNDVLFNAYILSDSDSAYGEIVNVLDFTGRTATVRFQDGSVTSVELASLAKITRRGLTYSGSALCSATLISPVLSDDGDGFVEAGQRVDVIEFDELGNVKISFKGIETWVPITNLDFISGEDQNLLPTAIFSALLSEEVELDGQVFPLGKNVAVLKVSSAGEALVSIDGAITSVSLHSIKHVFRNGKIQHSDSAMMSAVLKSDVIYEDTFIPASTTVDIVSLTPDGKYVQVQYGGSHTLVNIGDLDFGEMPGKTLFKTRVVDVILADGFQLYSTVRVHSINTDGTVLVSNADGVEATVPIKCIGVYYPHVSQHTVQLQPAKLEVAEVEFSSIKASDLGSDNLLFMAAAVFDYPQFSISADDIVEVYAEEQDWSLVKVEDRVDWVPSSVLRRIGDDKSDVNEYGERWEWCAVRPTMEIRQLVLDIVSRSAIFSEIRLFQSIEVFIDDVDLLLKKGRTVPGTLACILRIDDDKKKLETFSELAKEIEIVRSQWDPMVREAYDFIRLNIVALFTDPDTIQLSQIRIDNLLMESTAGGTGFRYLKHIAEKASKKFSGLEQLREELSDIHFEQREALKAALEDAKLLIVEFFKDKDASLFTGYIDVDMKSLEQMLVRGFTGRLIVAYLQKLKETNRKFETFGDVMGLIYQSHTKLEPPKHLKREYIKQLRAAQDSEFKFEFGPLNPQEKVTHIMTVVSNPSFKMFSEVQGNLQVQTADLLELLAANPRLERLLCDLRLLNIMGLKLTAFGEIVGSQSLPSVEAFKNQLVVDFASFMQSEFLTVEELERVITFSGIFIDPRLLLDSMFMQSVPFFNSEKLCLELLQAEQRYIRNRDEDQNLILGFLREKNVFSSNVQIFAHSIQTLVQVCGTSHKAIEVLGHLHSTGERFQSFELLVEAARKKIDPEVTEEKI